MQSDGTITRLTPEELAKLRERLSVGLDPDLVEIPEGRLTELQEMNRHDRRAWHARERKRRTAAQASEIKR